MEMIEPIPTNKISVTKQTYDPILNVTVNELSVSIESAESLEKCKEHLEDIMIKYGEKDE